MRFAVSLLTVLGIASIIGTVLKQNEPYTNYIVQFGQFWFEVFEVLGLYDVYHSVWFLLILVLTLEVLDAEPQLENTTKDYAPRPDYRPLTKFEKRGLNLGHGVWDIIFLRK